MIICVCLQLKLHSKSQYERAFKKWGFRSRNISHTEWKYIVFCLQEREGQGKSNSSVKVRGELVSDAKIKKQRRNHEMSTFEAIQASRFTTASNNVKEHIIDRTPELQTLDRPLTPSEVEVITPRSLSPAPSFELTISERNTDSTIDIPSLKDFLYACADYTPWHQFTQFLAAAPIESRHMATTKITQHHHPNHLSLIIPAKYQEVIADIIMHLYFDLEPRYEPFPAFIYPRLYLPSSRYDASNINLERLFDLSSRSSQVELLKYIVFLISNNFDVDTITHTVIELTQEQHNLEVFAHLLKQDLCSVNAFAEKLLLPATRRWNFALVEMLLGLGIGTRHLYSTDLLLRHAVAAGNEAVVLRLLARGANHEPHDDTSGQRICSILEIAILRGSLNIVTHLLQYSMGDSSRFVKIREEAFVAAVFRGDITVLNLLISRQPGMFEALKQTPWLLLEPASWGGSLAMLSTLQTMGFNICATDSLGNGSPLVYAVARGHNQLVEYLLAAGAKVSGYVYGTAATSLNLEFIRPRYLLKFSWSSTSRRYAAIHAAILRGDETLIRSLLSKGASPNQPGFMYPIQLATTNRDMKIIQVLLEKGADPDSAVPLDSSHSGHGRCLSCFSGCPQTRSILIALQHGDQEIFETLLKGGGTFPTPSSGPCQSHEIHWNPLLNAIQGGNKKLISRVLKGSHTHHKQWITRQCLTEFAQKFDWAFVTELVEKKLFPPDIFYQQQIMLLSIPGNVGGFVEDLIVHQRLQPNEAGVVFAKASRYGKEYEVRLFLEYGYWPDELFQMNSECYWRGAPGDGETESEQTPDRCSNGFHIYVAALVEAFKSKNKAIIGLLLNHYKKFSDKAQQPTFRKRFMQAYGIAIRYGDLHATEIFANIMGVDFVLNKELGMYILVEGGPYRSSVQLAAYFGHYHIVQWLLDHNANPDIPDEGIHVNPILSLYYPPLLYAVRSGELLVIKTLLEKGANVNRQPPKYDGVTALQVAAILGRFDTVDMLIEAGADINAPPGAFEGRSAIEGAAEWGRLDMARYLLDAGAGAGMLGKLNQNYRRAVYRAWKHDHHELAYMIHRWKKENDNEYSNTCDSIEAILRTTEPETLICAEGYKLEEARRTCRPSVCQVCVPQARTLFNEGPLLL